MNLNIVTLARVLKELPEPTHAGHILYWRFPSRCVELNRGNFRAIASYPESVTFRRIEFVAVQYAEGHRRWLEWELIA